MANDNNLAITVVINGQPMEVKVNVHQPLQAVAEEALGKSGNSGQPLESWEMRDGAGNVLDLKKRVQDYALAAGATLFLNLKAGVGG